MKFLNKKTWKKLVSYFLIGNLFISGFSNIVLGAGGTIIYTPDGPTLTSGDVTAVIGAFDESGVVITNNGGSDTYVFSTNGTFDFELSGDISTGIVTATVNWIDKIAPTVILTGDASGYTNTGFTMTVDFSETVTGFISGDLVITNGTLSNFTTISGSQYTFDVTPTAEGVVNVDLAADQCVDLAGNGNTIATQFSITYDITPSNISFTNNVETGPVMSDTVIANRGDAILTQYKLVASTGNCDGTSTTNYTGDLTFTTEGNNGNYVCLYAEDAAGNPSTATSDLTLNIDITEPTASAEFSTTGLTNQDVTVTITGFSETITGLNSTGFLFTGNGDYTFTFQDIAGNSGILTGTISWIDKTAVTGTVSYDITGWTNTDVFASIAFNKTGVTGITGYTFTGNGIYDFTFTDAYGNTGSETATVTWIDKTMPTFAGVTSGTSYSGSVSIIFDDANLSGAIVNGSSYTSGDTISTEGTNIFIVHDLAGNSTGATFIIDTTMPVITLNGTSTVTLEVFSIYNESGAVRSDNGLTGSANISGTVDTGTLGSYILDYRYSDGFHTNTESRTINIVDTTPPVITLIGSGTITLERTQIYSESGANRSDNYDGTGAVIDITGTVNEQISGTYIITYQKVDASGNTGTNTRTINVIDTTSPTANIEYSTTGLTNQDVTATITGFSETITGLNATNNVFTGNGSFVFTFQDIYGNPGSGTATVNRIDKTPVTGAISYDITGWTNTDVIASITFNKTGVSGPTGYTFTGNDTFDFTFTDTYGNTGLETATVTWIDKTDPLITSTGSVTTSTGGVEFSGIQITETGAGINTITLNYSGIINSTGVGSIGLSTGDLTNISGSIVGLDDNQTYIYTITAIDLVGNTGTIIGGTFTTLFDYQEEYTDIAAALQAANISGNLDTVTNDNVSSFPGLYFEKSAGKITFLNTVDLTDTGTIAFIQNLDSYLSMSGGFINFIISSGSTDSGSALQNVQAELTMYMNTALLPDGNPDESLIVVKDNNGTIITPSSSIISNLSCAGSSPQVCTFTTSHFTSFGVKPILSGVNIQSNNASGSRALSGNIITLTFTGSENLTGVSATIFGNVASVVGAGSAWSATYTTDGTETDGLIPFTIDFEDLFGNAGDTITGTTDASLVTFDKTFPSITINNPDTSPAQSKTITATGSDINLSGFLLSITGSATCDGTLTFQTYTSLTFTGESDNGTYVCYQMIDFAGNITYSGSNMITGIDTTNPTATVDYNPASGAWTNTDVIAALTGYSESLTGINQTGYTFTDNDNFTFTFSDLAGNTGETIAIVDRIDKTDPTFAGVTSGSYYNTNQAISFSDDNLSGATLNGATYISGASISADNNYIFIVYDLAGNFSGATFVVDKTQPTFAGVTSGSYYNSNQAITFSDTNLSGATLNGAAYISGETISADNTYIFIAYDLAENSTGATFVVDKTLPTIGTGIISTGNTGNNGTTLYYNGTITIQATMSDALAGISGATCEYSTGISRASATYSGGGGFCSISGLSPTADINIRFRVQDVAGNLNTGGITTYIYDITAPITTDNANSITGRVDVTVTLTPTDGGVGTSGTLYCVDTGGTCTPTILGTSVSVTGVAGTVTHKYVRYYSIDKLGNTEATNTSVQIHIDKETPILTGTTTFSSDNSTNTGYAKVNDTITVFFQSHEALTGTPTMTISGGSLTTGIVTNIGGNNFSGTFLMKNTDVEGLISFNIFMTDLVGNTGTTTTTSTLIFDRTNPADITVTAPTTGSYLKGDPDVFNITWNTGTDANRSPTSILLEYSVTNFVSTTNIHTGTANDGLHTFMFPNTLNTFAKVRIIATDLAGNISYFTGNQFSIDNTPPTDITIIYPGLYLKGNSGYQIDRSGGIDANPQTIILAYTTNGTTFTTICTRTNNEQNCSWTTPVLNSATVQLRTTATDEVGMNKQRTTPTFVVDSTAPTSIVFSDTNSNRRNTSATATGTSTDNFALRTTGVVYRTDTAFTGNCDGGTTVPPTFTTDGVYTGYACVMDRAGNIRTGQQSYQIDITAPLLSMGSDIATNTGVVVDITTTGDISGILGYARSKVSGPGTISFTTSIIEDPTVTADTDGDYVIKVIVTDNAGNQTSGTINMTRDTTGPTINSGAITNTTSQTPTFTFTADQTGSISWSGSCGSATTTLGSGSNSITLSSLANATYSTCYIRGTDALGNIGARYNLPTFTVSYSAGGGGGGGGGGGYVEPTCTISDLICENGVWVEKPGVTCIDGGFGSACSVTTTVTTGVQTEIEESVGFLYKYGLTKYNTVASFQPQNYITREQAAKFYVMYAMNVLGKTPNTSRTKNFIDIADADPSLVTSIQQSYQLSIFNGYEDGSFRMRNNITRGESLAVLMRIHLGKRLNEETLPWYKNYFNEAKRLGILESSADIADFNDPVTRSELGIFIYRSSQIKCAAGSCQYNVVNVIDNITSAILDSITTVTTGAQTEIENTVGFLYENGLTKYDTVSAFQVNNYITREQASKFYTMFAKSVLGQMPDESKTKNFTDISQADPTLKQHIIRAYQLGIFNGYPDGTFKPFNSLTQGEAIAVLMRIYLGKKLNEQDIFPRYKNYFNEAKRLGVLDAETTTENFNDNITRGNMGIFIYRVSQLQ